MRKTLKTSGKPGRQCQCLFQWPAISYCHQRSGPSRLAGTDPSNSDTATAVCVGGGVCVRTSVRACVHACVRDVFAIHDNNIWPRLIMIIIRNIILYFIQIRHTDDFPSTGTRLVFINDLPKNGENNYYNYCMKGLTILQNRTQYAKWHRHSRKRTSGSHLTIRFVDNNLQFNFAYCVLFCHGLPYSNRNCSRHFLGRSFMKMIHINGPNRIWCGMHLFNEDSAN